MLDDIKQTSFGEVPKEAPRNIEAPGESHLACVLLLDTSGSMAGEAIESLNKGINDFITQTAHDEKTCKRVDLAIIEFNDTARVVQDFVPIRHAEPVKLTAGGCTAMGQAINMAIDKVKQKNKDYAALGTPVYQPWIVMITDGAPTDDISLARQRINEEETKGTHGKLKFWALGVRGYHKETLQSLTKRCLELDGTNFEGFFDWMRESVAIISVSRVDDNPPLPPTPEDVHVIPPTW